jgi:hypothetical protein
LYQKHKGWKIMLLKWNPTRIVVLPLVKTAEAHEAINITRDQVNLLPGVNEISDDEWEIVRAHCKEMIRRGDLEILMKDVPAGKGKSKTARNLTEMPSNEAKKLIAQAVNPDTLQKWEQEESREEIRTLIQRRMAKLKVDPADEVIPDDNEPVETGDPVGDE